MIRMSGNIISRYLDNTDKKLAGYGVKYMFPGLSVQGYIIIRFIIMLFAGGMMYALKLPFYAVFAVGIAGYILPEILMKVSNKSDNENMMADIECIYDIMRIQARAGVFIGDSLMDCYVSTVNKRLKSALLELCNQTSTSKTMEEAIAGFAAKFNNRHIDVLCIVLSQALSSGKTVQILSDMSEQINQLRHSRAKSDEGKLERKIEVAELLIFIGILAIGILAMGNEIAGMIDFN